MINYQPLVVIFNRKNFIIGVLLFAVVMSGVAVNYTSYESRSLHNTLQRILEGQNRAQVEWGRLLLEESTLTTPARVESLARDKLNMDVPNHVEMVAQ